ncbi:MAG TPA: nuclear transport factor 2 family protein, partial [Candidatus Binatia bacterium]|nr:nuclear transport factor 2 family protein [Candidatus Binatia bacterium]
DFKMTGFEIRNLRLDVSSSGTVAWWSCILDEAASWAGRPVGWKDTRWTGVLEKRAGKWLIVQMHFSFAAKQVPAQATQPGETSRQPIS